MEDPKVVTLGGRSLTLKNLTAKAVHRMLSRRQALKSLTDEDKKSDLIFESAVDIVHACAVDEEGKQLPRAWFDELPGAEYVPLMEVWEMIMKASGYMEKAAPGEASGPLSSSENLRSSSGSSAQV